jgi:hypothetical protein
MQKRAKAAGYIGSATAVVSIGFAKCGFGEKFDAHSTVKVAQAIILCGWILLPPIWFAWEYHKFESSPANPFDEFKFGQEIASKVWLALVTVLTILYFGKDLQR